VPLKAPEGAPLMSPKTSKFILLGEDDIDNEELLREVFAKVDNTYELLFVNNGKKLVSVLESLVQGPLPCLIILDYNMPALNGSEILEEIKKHPRFDNVPKVIWSTSSSNTYKELCLKLGARDYVIKPSNMQGLVEVARYMLSFCSGN